jgi:multidrug resistance protein, MATE family
MIGGSDAVRSTAIAYIQVRAWSAPAVLINMALIGWLIGLGRTPVVFVLQLLLNLVNAGLAIGFVTGLGWGVPGAAAATAIADWTAAIAGLGYAGHVLRANGWTASRAAVLARAQLRRAVSTNRDITIRTLCIVGVFAFFVSEGASAGDVTLAANAVLFQLTMVTVFLIDGFETAAQTLVGQAVGAGDRAGYRASVALCTLWAALLGGGLALLLWFAGPSLIAILTTSAEVRSVAGHYLIWAALIPILGLWAFILDGIFIGATRGRDLRNMMLISTAIYAVAWVGLTAWLGNHGLWLALIVFFLARAATLAVRLPALQRDAFDTPAATPAG